MSFNFSLNRNGDDPETLKGEFLAVMDAARKLQDAIAAMTMHQRNYQTRTDPLIDFNIDRDAKAAKYNEAVAIYEWAMDGASEVIFQATG